MRTFFLLPVVLVFLSCSDSPSTKADASKRNIAVTAPSPKAVQEAPTKKTITAEVAPVNGHSIYAHKCASCHGQNGEKIALNSSKIIAGWDSTKTVNVLKGYQSDTYGNKLKGIMKAQAKVLNAVQIKAVANYIATL